MRVSNLLARYRPHSAGAPDADDMRYILSRIAAAGYDILDETLFDAEPDALNSQVGYRLTLARLPDPPAGVDQLVIF